MREALSSGVATAAEEGEEVEAEEDGDGEGDGGASGEELEDLPLPWLWCSVVAADKAWRRGLSACAWLTEAGWEELDWSWNRR